MKHGQLNKAESAVSVTGTLPVHIGKNKKIAILALTQTNHSSISNVNLNPNPNDSLKTKKEQMSAHFLLSNFL